MRGEEAWVGACIEAALPGVKVVQHDDGSRSSMHDLTLYSDGVPFGACEVTAAADARSIELWNLINGSDERWIEQDLPGGWMVTVVPRCKAKALKRDLPGVLRSLERAVDPVELARATDALYEMGVVDADRGETDFQGSVYVTLARGAGLTGGIVARTADALVPWFNSWVTEEGQRHNLEKLRAAKYTERHLFVLLPGFTTAPLSVSDLLMRSETPLPNAAPRLPVGLTDVWLMST
jgi:hypothetical protein